MEKQLDKYWFISKLRNLILALSRLSRTAETV